MSTPFYNHAGKQFHRDPSRMFTNSSRFVIIFFSSELISVRNLYQLFIGYIIKSKINYSKLLGLKKKKKHREGPNSMWLSISNKTVAFFLWISGIFPPNIPGMLIKKKKILYIKYLCINAHYWNNIILFVSQEIQTIPVS